MPEPIVVTGVGCVSGLGIGVAELRQGVLSGRTAVAPIRAFDTAACRSQCAATLDGFDPVRFVSPARLRRVDRIGGIALAACRLALDAAALTQSGDAVRNRVGVVLGSYSAGVRTTIEYLDTLIERGPAGASPMMFSNTVGNAAASLCAIEHALRGPNVTLTNKEASAGAAIAMAFYLLRQGRARAIVTGGVDDLEPTFFAIHDRLRVLASGDEASRPFDRRRNGFVLGEGGFLVVLEQLSSATARRVDWDLELLGVGATASACATNQWPDDAGPLSRCMRMALDAAKVPSDRVGVVFASANSTQQLDRLEAEALTEVFRSRRVPVVALKGALGECGGGGATAVATAAACVRARVMPPTAGCDQPDPQLNVDVSTVSRPWPGAGDERIGLLNSFASGGTNYSLVVRRSGP